MLGPQEGQACATVHQSSAASVLDAVTGAVDFDDFFLFADAFGSTVP